MLIKDEKKLNHGEKTGIYQKKLLLHFPASNAKVSSTMGFRYFQTQMIQEK